ncbi:MAG: 2TM domain-containing protein [Cruoricaptor ignavus]|nr:2TM domain-containing protein [Cruoricaptor ignavus]
MKFNAIRHFRVLLVVCVVSSVFFFLLSTNEKTSRNYLLSLGISAMYTFGYGISNGWLNAFLDRQFSWMEQTKQRIFATIISVLLLNIFLTYFFNYVHYILIQGGNPEYFFSPMMNLINWFLITFALLISAVLHAKGFINALTENTKQQVTEQKIIAKSADARFESLRNQLDPHFLFNSLNVLDALIDENPENAKRFTSSLSSIYRYVLEQRNKELVTLQDELVFAETYCNLLKTRFEDSICFNFEISDEELSKLIVPLSLQLLLENSIKHNFATSEKPLIIRIFCENDKLCVMNNSQLRNLPFERRGIGLSNIIQRYEFLTNDEVFVEQTEHYFTVKIPLLTEKSIKMKRPEITETTLYEKAKTRVDELASFYGHLISFCVVMPFLFLLNWWSSPSYWWAFWALAGWGIGLASHAFRVFFGFGNRWKEKQIQKYMD